MLTKAEQTAKYIIEKVAPLFNQKGYAATSMSEITQATGLTKGAIYGNFENKETLAIAAFKKNANDLLKKVGMHQDLSSDPLEKLYLITDFYRNYYLVSQQLGGCPILNIGVDAVHQDNALLMQVQRVINKTQEHIVKLVSWGQAEGKIRAEVDPIGFARFLYTSIQGAIFMSQTMDDYSYLTEATREVDRYMDQHLRP